MQICNLESFVALFRINAFNYYEHQINSKVKEDYAGDVEIVF